MKLAKTKLRQTIKENNKMKVTKTKLKQIIKEELTAVLNEQGPRKYGDDVDTPSLQAQMQTAILAAVEALDAGDVEAARAAFPEDLLKELRPYAGPVGKIPTSAQLATQAGYDI